MKKNLAILTTSNKSITETFIQNHIVHLPQNNTVFYGAPFPYIVNQDVRLGIIDEYLLKLKAKNQKKDWLLLYKENQLRKNLQKHSINLVLAEFLTTGAEVLNICKELEIPMIVTALGYDISTYTVIKKYEKEYRDLFDYAKAIIIVSNHMRKNLLELGCDESKIVYSPAGPDKSFFDITPDYSKNNIVALGRFVEKKAPHLLILSFQKVVEKIPDAHLFFGGDGPLMSVVKDLIKVLNIEKHVTLLGMISQQEQKKYFEKSSIFVQHSKTAENGDSEGTPVTILEASAAGLPIVSTLHAGIPEVVKDGETGFLVSENDIDYMSKKIIDLLENKELAKKMGKKGKSFVKDNFSLEKHINIINSVIES